MKEAETINLFNFQTLLFFIWKKVSMLKILVFCQTCYIYRKTDKMYKFFMGYCTIYTN